MRKTTSGLILGLTLAVLAFNVGCGSGGAPSEPKIPGSETIRSTPAPPTGIGFPPLPP